MNKIKHKKIILPFISGLLLLISGCVQNYNNKTTFTQDELLAALNMVRGEITASDAAKKIAEKNGQNIGNLGFTEAKYLAYDDKAGTFAVKVKGTKDGIHFDTTFNVSGFIHPYRDTLLNSPVYQEGNKLIFNKVIEKNTGLQEFIAEANAAKGIGYTSFSYTLMGSDKTVSIGDHSAYKLVAGFSENAGKIKIEAKYYIKYKTYTGSGEENVETDPVSNKTVSSDEPYFTKEDVFKYILDEVKKDDGFIQTGNKFASEFYARAVTSNKTPAGLFDTSKLQKYRDVYKPGSGGYLVLPDIDAAVYDPRNNGIKADDFAGTLHLTYYIATQDLINNIGSNGFIPKTLETTKTGFRKIDEATAKDLFSFALAKSTGNLTDWKASSISEDSLIKEQGTFSDMSWLTVLENVVLKGYTLSLNGYSNFVFDKVLADKNNAFLSKGRNGELMLIKSIKFSKEENTQDLKISIIFEGKNNGADGEPIVLTAIPNL